MAVETISTQSITVTAGQPIYIPKNATIVGIDATGSATYSSECYDLTGVPVFECYGSFICVSQGGGDTDNYEHFDIIGMMINGSMVNFGTSVTMTDGSLNGGADALLAQIALTPQGSSGIIKELARCDSLDGDGRGSCIAISFKTIPAIATDMRFVAAFQPLGDDVENTTYIHFPVRTVDDMLTTQGVTLCGCGEIDA